MADNRTYLQAQKFRLASSITATDTSVDVESFQLPDGDDITASDIGTALYATIGPGTDTEEQIKITDVTQNSDDTATLTVERGIKFSPDYTSENALRNAHSANSVMVVSNTSAFYASFANKENDETITQQWTFDQFPEMSDTTDPSNNTDLAHKKYVDDTASGTATLSNVQVLVQAVAGETVADGDVVYFDESDGEWYRADATNSSEVLGTVIGIAQGSGSDGNAIGGGGVVIEGTDDSQSYTAGQAYYVSDTAGSTATSPGTNERKIGVGDANNNLVLEEIDGLSRADTVDESSRDSGTPSNDEDKVVELESDGKFADFFIPRVTATGDTSVSIDATTNPKAVYFQDTSGNINLSNASNTNTAKFIGFFTEDTTSSGVGINHVNSSGINDDGNFTANAGNKRVLIVYTLNVGGGNSTGVTWGGVSMTKVGSNSTDNDYIDIYALAIGDSASNETQTLSFSNWGGGDGDRGAALVYENVDQNNVVQSNDIDAPDSSPANNTLTITKAPTFVVQGGQGDGISLDDMDSDRVSQDYGGTVTTDMKVGDKNETISGSNDYTATANGVSTLGAVELNPHTVSVDIACSRKVDGFSGLSVGAKYYVQDTDGNIGTSTGSNTVFVGKAISETELLIAHDA